MRNIMHSYDGFIISCEDYQYIDRLINPNSTVYSDRLFQWDPEKHDGLCLKYFGNTRQYWDNRSPELIEQYLRDYTNKPELILGRITQETNQSSGYPYWRFDYLVTKENQS